MSPSKVSSRSVVIAIACVLVACRSPRSPSDRPSKQTQIEMLDRIALVARGSGLTARERADLASAPSIDIAGTVRKLARSDGAIDYAASVLFPRQSELKSYFNRERAIGAFPASDGGLIYSAWEPCEPADAVEVTPWWDISKRVRVCRDSYRPEVLFEEIEVNGVKERFACPNMMNGNKCGCGPYLMLCAPDEMVEDVLQGYRFEFVKTIAQLVRNGAPLTDIFTTEYSFRDRRAELFYARAKVARGDSPAAVFESLAKWPKEGKWAKRDQSSRDQIAGIVTMPQMIWQEDVPRLRTQAIQEMAWCIDNRSVRVDSESMLALKGKDFRFSNEEQYDLAHKPVCESCHARLDYGLEFFRGYRAYTFLEPSDQRTSKIYFGGIHDLRANDVPATPRVWAEHAIAMDEFGQCMTRRIVDHVFGDEAVSADHLALLEVFKSTKSYLPMLELALERRLTRLLRGSRTKPDEAIASLDAVIETHCGDCHGAGQEVELSLASLDAKLAIAAVTEVSEGRMPKQFPPLGWTERETIIRALLSRVPLQVERDALFASMTKAQHNISIPRTRALASQIHSRIGVTGQDTPAILPYDAISRSHSELSPEVIVGIAAETLRACKSKYKDRKQIDACMRRGAAGIPAP